MKQTNPKILTQRNGIYLFFCFAMLLSSGHFLGAGILTFLLLFVLCIPAIGFLVLRRPGRKANQSNFIVVALLEVDDYGFDENTLPPLVLLADLAEPDHRTFTHTGVVTFFLSSPQARKRVDKLVADAKIMRESQKGYETLGIGIAEGPMIVFFTGSGNTREYGSAPLGDVTSKACKNSQTEGRTCASNKSGPIIQDSTTESGF